MMDRLNSALRRLPTWVVYGFGAVPFAVLAFAVATGDLGPDPVKTLERDVGEWALRFLLLTLAVSPLRSLGINALKFRRALGLLTFFYALLHVAVWAFLDMGLRLDEIARDLTRRPYIIAGLLAFAILVPLALTSSNAAIRRMGGASWRRLHLLVYPALALGLLHMILQAKVWTTDVVVYSAIGLALLAFRLPRLLRTLAAGARPSLS
jgi:methionine sulfoxide reductase heme-binding subunit